MKSICDDEELVKRPKWLRFPTVHIAAADVPDELNYSSSDFESVHDDIVELWRGVVVLRATSAVQEKFRTGFYDRFQISYIDHEFVTDVVFAMRQGPESVNFFVLPGHRDAEIDLSVVTYTKLDDPRFKDIPLI